MNNRHFLRRDNFRRLRKSAVIKSSTDSHVQFTWTPELFGPLFGAEKITLWQVNKSKKKKRKIYIVITLFINDK